MVTQNRITDKQRSEEQFQDWMKQQQINQSLKDQEYEKEQDIKEKELAREEGSLLGLAALPLVGIAGLFNQSEAKKAQNGITREKNRLIRQFRQQQELKMHETLHAEREEFIKSNPNATAEQIDNHTRKERQKYRFEAKKKEADFRSNVHNTAYRNYEQILARKDPTGKRLEAFHTLETGDTKQAKNFQKWQVNAVNNDLKTTENIQWQVHAQRELNRWSDPSIGGSRNSRKAALTGFRIKEKTIFGRQKSDEKLAAEIANKQTFRSTNQNLAQSIKSQELVAREKFKDYHPFSYNRYGKLLNKQYAPVSQEKLKLHTEALKKRRETLNTFIYGKKPETPKLIRPANTKISTGIITAINKWVKPGKIQPTTTSGIHFPINAVQPNPRLQQKTFLQRIFLGNKNIGGHQNFIRHSGSLVQAGQLKNNLRLSGFRLSQLGIDGINHSINSFGVRAGISRSLSQFANRLGARLVNISPIPLSLKDLRKRLLERIIIGVIIALITATFLITLDVAAGDPAGLGGALNQ